MTERPPLPSSAVAEGLAREARLIAAAPNLLAAVRAFIAEHENLEDRAPADPGCIECNMGAGPHKATCAYHLGRAAVRKAEGAPS